MSDATKCSDFVTVIWSIVIRLPRAERRMMKPGRAMSVVSLWFVRRRGLAISLAFTGASFGGVVVTPVLMFLVERFGFPAAMLTGTAIMVAVLVPVAVAWIGPPSAGGPAERQIDDSSQAQMSSTPSGISRAKLVRCLAFWTISIPFALALLAQVGFIVHQIALLEPKIGRGSAGFARHDVHGDRRPPRPRRGCRPARSAAHHRRIPLKPGGGAPDHPADDSVPIILAACAVFGFSVGNIITLPPLIIHREFSAASFVVVMGLSNAISGVVGALGPALVGLVRGWSGGCGAALRSASPWSWSQQRSLSSEGG